MEINLELSSCEQEKLVTETNANIDVVDATTDGISAVEEHVNSPVSIENLREDHASEENQIVSSGKHQFNVNTASADIDTNEAICDPQVGLVFDSKEDAYSFYREYARALGFGITIKASRRSKKSGNFIDIKIACSRFGTKRETGMSVNVRSFVKTDCRASMHIKRKEDGKWIIHAIVKEHNHEICPDDFYYAMKGRNKKSSVVPCQKKGLQLALDEGDVHLMLEYFTFMQDKNRNFFYAVDLDHEKRLRSVLWVDAKGRHDYNYFHDVVFFDTYYVTNRYRMPLVPIVGVNNHFQYILLGCALVGEETTSTFVWLMQTWLKAVGSQAPRVVITDQDKFLEEAIANVFPETQHCFCLWHVLRRIPENLGCVIEQHENFMEKFNKCINRSWTIEEFEKKWWKMVNRFELREDEWICFLYDNREKWVPAYMQNSFLAGMSTTKRSYSVTSFFDQYINPETKFKEIIKVCEELLKEIYDMEADADFITWHKQPELRSFSQFEQQMSCIYTDAVFRKFKAEALGIASCHLQREGEDGTTTIFRVDDFKERRNFIVAWNEVEFKICCLCRSFEYQGFLCRHALAVLQMSGVSDIPSHYILKRWTKNAKVRDTFSEMPKRLNSRLQRFNDLCKLAIKLGEAGSVSQESYNIAFQALEKVLKQCVDANDSVSHGLEPNIVHDILDVEQEENGKSMAKSSRSKKASRKRKVSFG